MGKLIIEHVCKDKERRPPVSFLLRLYLSDYTANLVLDKYSFSNSQYDIMLSIIFSPDSDITETPEYLLSHPTVFEDDMLKLYSVFVPFNIHKYEDELEAYVEVCLNAIILFLEKTYKELSDFDFELFYKRIDMDYIYNIPFPAPFEEQKFVGDSTESMN